MYGISNLIKEIEKNLPLAFLPPQSEDIAPSSPGATVEAETRSSPNTESTNYWTFQPPEL
jgi:hypothetical protein